MIKVFKFVSDTSVVHIFELRNKESFTAAYSFARLSCMSKRVPFTSWRINERMYLCIRVCWMDQSIDQSGF